MASSSRRPRHSRQQWAAWMAEYERSGLTQEAFCARQDLALSTFSAWRQRLSSERKAEALDPGEAGLADFMSLALPSALSSAPEAWVVELTLPSGMTVRMR